MVDTVSSSTVPLGMEPLGAATHAARPTAPPAPPVMSNLEAMLAHQIEQFSQSHLASQASQFATAHGCPDDASKAELAQVLRDIAHLLTQLMQRGQPGPQAHGGESGVSDKIKQSRLRAEQEINDIKEQSRIDEMIAVARMEAKQAKERRQWLLQNLM